MREAGGTPTRARLPGLDGLRAVACLIVMLSHFLAMFYPASVIRGGGAVHSPPDAAWLGSPLRFLTNGEFAVAVFFALSGFVLTADLFDHEDRAVLPRRALGRIVRLGIPAGVSSIIAWGLISAGAYSVARTARIVGAETMIDDTALVNIAHPIWHLLNNLIWNTWFASPSIHELYNPVLWTMNIEFQGSMLAFFCVLVLGGARIRAFIGARTRTMVLVLLAAALVWGGGQRGVYLATLLAGVAIASSRGRRLPTPVALALGILGCLLGGFNASAAFQRPATDLDCLGGVLVLWATVSCRPLTAMFAARPLPWIGRISFSLYLLHLPILYTVGSGIFLASDPAAGYATATAAAFGGFVVTSLVAAWLFEIAVDRPATLLARRCAAMAGGILRAGQLGSPPPPPAPRPIPTGEAGASPDVAPALAPEVAPTIKRNDAIDGLRGWLSVAVCLYHGFLIPQGDGIFAIFFAPLGQTQSVSRKMLLQVINGDLAVNVFFVMSGAVLFGSLSAMAKERRPAGLAADFAIRRLFRIFPALIAALSLFGASYWLLQRILPNIFHVYFTAGQWLVNVLLLDISMYGASWSLQVELVAVPFVLLAFWVWRRFGEAGMAVCLALSLLARDAPWLTLGLPHLHEDLFLFVLGMLAIGPVGGAVTRGIGDRGALLIPLITILGASVVDYRDEMVRPFQGLLSALFVAALFHGRLPRIGAALRAPLSLFLGRISYGFYVINPIFLEFNRTIIAAVGGSPPASFATELLLGVSATACGIPLSALCYRYIEVPGIRAGRRAFPALLRHAGRWRALARPGAVSRSR